MLITVACDDQPQNAFFVADVSTSRTRVISVAARRSRNLENTAKIDVGVVYDAFQRNKADSSLHTA